MSLVQNHTAPRTLPRVSNEPFTNSCFYYITSFDQFTALALVFQASLPRWIIEDGNAELLPVHLILPALSPTDLSTKPRQCSNTYPTHRSLAKLHSPARIPLTTPIPPPPLPTFTTNLPHLQPRRWIPKFDPDFRRPHPRCRRLRRRHV